MTTFREQIDVLYRTGKVANKLILDQAVMAGVAVDDEDASAAHRQYLVDRAEQEIQQAATKAQLDDAVRLHVGWLRHIDPSCLGHLKAEYHRRLQEVS